MQRQKWNTVCKKKGVLGDERGAGKISTANLGKESKGNKSYPQMAKKVYVITCLQPSVIHYLDNPLPVKKPEEIIFKS